MRRVIGWLTRGRFAWSDVIIIGTTVSVVASSHLPELAGLAICAGGGFLASVVTRLLRAAGRRGSP